MLLIFFTLDFMTELSKTMAENITRTHRFFKYFVLSLDVCNLLTYTLEYFLV